MRRLWLFPVSIVLAIACTSSPEDDCAASGGTCVLGGVWCSRVAASSAQDCNPDRNPGGAFCCLAVADASAAEDVTADSQGSSDALDTGADRGE